MARHPIRLRVSDDLRRSRLTVFFRLLLALPHLVWVTLWSIPAVLAAIASWFVTLFTGRSPLGLHNFLAAFVRYTTHVYAYTWLVADPFPGFLGRPGYPIDVEIDPPEPQNRWVTGFRLVLAIPAFVLTAVLQQVAQVIAFFAWFVALALGRIPAGMRDFSAFCLHYSAQTHGYASLLTDRYPALSMKTDEPVEAAEAQSTDLRSY